MAGETLNLSRHIGGISITDGDQYARIDMVTGALQTMEYEHHEIHAGSHFVTTAIADAAGSAIFGMLLAPASTSTTTKKPHVVFEAETELEAESQLWEGVTVSGLGTVVPCINRERTKSTTATMLVYHTPTSPVTTGATMLYGRHFGTASGPQNQNGGSHRAEHEFVLAPSLLYYWMCKNATGSSNQTTLHADWYEHTDKDELTLIV